MTDTNTITSIETAPRRRGRPPGPANRQVNLDSPLFEGKLTIPRVAADCGRSEKTVKRWISEGLPVERYGYLVLIDVEKFRAWMSRRVRGGLAAPRKRARNAAP
jgi:hypothetical protein